MTVLRAAGSAVSQRSDGMKSYFEKNKKDELNVDAKTFIPQNLGQAGKEQTVIGNGASHFNRSQQSHKETDTAMHLHHGPSDYITQDTQAMITTSPMSQPRNVQTPFSWGGSNDQQQICSIMEKQNEITAMLVDQQSLSTLPRRDLDI